MMHGSEFDFINIAIQDAAAQSSFSKDYTTANVSVYYNRSSHEIDRIRMAVNWDGFADFGAPVIEGTFRLGQSVSIYTGKCLPFSQLEDVGGVIEAFEVSQETQTVHVLIKGVRHFLLDCRQKPALEFTDAVKARSISKPKACKAARPKAMPYHKPTFPKPLPSLKPTSAVDAVTTSLSFLKITRAGRVPKVSATMFRFK